MDREMERAMERENTFLESLSRFVHHYSWEASKMSQKISMKTVFKKPSGIQVLDAPGAMQIQDIAKVVADVGEPLDVFIYVSCWDNEKNQRLASNTIKWHVTPEMFSGEATALEGEGEDEGGDELLEMILTMVPAGEREKFDRILPMIKKMTSKGGDIKSIMPMIMMMMGKDGPAV